MDNEPFSVSSLRDLIGTAWAAPTEIAGLVGARLRSSSR